jgi:hypothetical protein
MHVNWFAVVAAALAAFVVGGVWYSPLLFVKAWKAEVGVPEDAKASLSSMAPQFAGTLVLSIVQAGMFAIFLGSQTPAMGAAYGFAAGLCWVAAAFGVNYLYEGRSLRLWLINGGYNVVIFTLYGLILSLWK